MLFSVMKLMYVSFRQKFYHLLSHFITFSQDEGYVSPRHSAADHVM